MPDREAGAGCTGIGPRGSSRPHLVLYGVVVFLKTDAYPPPKPVLINEGR